MSLSAKEARAYHATPGESTRSQPNPANGASRSSTANPRPGRVRPAWVALGANLGDPRTTLLRALRWLGALPHTRLEAASRIHRTAAFDPDPAAAPQPDYLNAVARLSTALDPTELMRALLVLERAAGRVRTRRNGPRTLDLDLLLMGAGGALCLDRPSPQDVSPPAFHAHSAPDLILPHPRLHQRRFVLAPLVELDPDLIHPRLGQSLQHLLAAL
ncbi:MAG: 2-amino-4-hydroxy-6-hydroxymethyldihydropteridine diphosphokinase [Deltaproteobacteria bacterium]|nr:2-amino-4-hydroxy-6-hydroxymethyldihydropteridine diphosphokinase [Deltaproteobacteria bacterium]